MRTVWQDERRAAPDGRAAVPDRQRVLAGDRRARHLDPGDRPPAAGRRAGGRHRCCCCWTWARGTTGWAARRWPRCTGSWATSRPTWRTPRRWSGSSTPSRRCRPRASCWRTTTGPTAACWSPCWRWRSPAGWGWTSISTALARAVADQGGPADPLALLFAEEIGAVVEVRRQDEAVVRQTFAAAGLPRAVHVIARLTAEDRISIGGAPGVRYQTARSHLRGVWSDTTFRMQSLRDDPACAAEEQADPHRCHRPRPGRGGRPVRLRGGIPRRPSPGRRARGWPSCASRGSTARSRWRRPSTGPASRRSTST